MTMYKIMMKHKDTGVHVTCFTEDFSDVRTILYAYSNQGFELWRVRRVNKLRQYKVWAVLQDRTGYTPVTTVHETQDQALDYAATLPAPWKVKSLYTIELADPE